MNETHDVIVEVREGRDLTVRNIVGQIRQLLERSVTVMVIVVISCTSYLLFANTAYAVPFLLLGLTTTFSYGWSVYHSRNGLPVLAVVMLQHGIAYGTPLMVQNASLDAFSNNVINLSTYLFTAFGLATIVGWQIGTTAIASKPSRYPLIRSRFSRVTIDGFANIGFGLLLFALIFQLLVFTGYYWSLAGNMANRLFPVIRAFALVAQVAGAFVAGFAIKRTGRKVVTYWSLWIPLFILLISSILLSSAVGMVLATITGFSLGLRRVAWRETVVIFLVISFLNVGKFEMRSRYWAGTKNSSPSITMLPGYFAEWAGYSVTKLQAGLFSENPDEDADKGQALLDRINNFQNIAWVVRAIDEQGLDTLEAGGYRQLPSVLVPRLFWPNKPRTHEGQIMLNLHFNRQVNEKATETTYVAWGLLPEAIGNLGLWSGAIFFGLFLGFVSGLIETWSIEKSLFSVEGISSCLLMIYFAVSFEMAAGVLLALLMQTMVVVLVGSFVIRRINFA